MFFSVYGSLFYPIPTVRVNDIIYKHSRSGQETTLSHQGIVYGDFQPKKQSENFFEKIIFLLLTLSEVRGNMIKRLKRMGL